MNATLLYRQKETRADLIREIVIWQLREPLPGCCHSLKYRLFFGRIDGTCLIRYDNERGKGDHRHIGTREEPYHFSTVEKLLTDFAADIRAILAEVGGSL